MLSKIYGYKNNRKIHSNLENVFLFKFLTIKKF